MSNSCAIYHPDTDSYENLIQLEALGSIQQIINFSNFWDKFRTFLFSIRVATNIIGQYILIVVQHPSELLSCKIC